MLVLTRRLVCSFLLANTRPRRTLADEGQLFTRTFGEGALGLILSEAADGRTQVTSVVEGSPAWKMGVPPLSFVVSVSGRSVSGTRAPSEPI